MYFQVLRQDRLHLGHAVGELRAVLRGPRVRHQRRQVSPERRRRRHWQRRRQLQALRPGTDHRKAVHMKPAKQIELD